MTVKRTIQLFLFVFLLGGAASAATFTEQDYAKFNQAMQDQLDVAEAKVMYLQRLLSDRDRIASSADRAAFENAWVTLDVKRSLVANFTNAPSIQSPLVRNYLMSLLKAEIIMAGDLAELQALVNREKRRLNLDSPEKQPAQQQ